MAQTKPSDETTLDELERLHEAHNRRRGRLLTQRRELEKKLEKGEPVHRDLKTVERDLDQLEAEVDQYLPALQDARRRQAAEIHRASRIDRLERDIATYQDVIAFQETLADAAEKYLRPHFTRAMTTTGPIPSPYVGIAREALLGRFHENGDNNTARQLRTRLARAQAELEELRKADG